MSKKNERLNNKARNQIMRNLIASQVPLYREKCQRLRELVSRYVYAWMPNTLALVEKLPAGFLRTETHVTVEIPVWGDETWYKADLFSALCVEWGAPHNLGELLSEQRSNCYLDVGAVQPKALKLEADERFPIPYNSYKSLTLTSGKDEGNKPDIPCEDPEAAEEVLKELTCLVVEINHLLHDIVLVHSQARPLLAGSGTRNSLLQRWPEVEPFLPEEITKVKSQLPAIPLTELNNMVLKFNPMAALLAKRPHKMSTIIKGQIWRPFEEYSDRDPVEILHDKQGKITFKSITKSDAEAKTLDWPDFMRKYGWLGDNLEAAKKPA